MGAHQQDERALGSSTPPVAPSSLRRTLLMLSSLASSVATAVTSGSLSQHPRTTRSATQPTAPSARAATRPSPHVRYLARRPEALRRRHQVYPRVLLQRQARLQAS